MNVTCSGRTVRLFHALIALCVMSPLAGCGTTRSTDTPRSATEQLLVSRAVDEAVAECDFTPLNAKTVYLDVTQLDVTSDHKYLASSVRQALLAAGALLQEERTKATYVVEVRSGALGTDRNSILVGIPQTSVPIPSLMPSAPTLIPEIPFAKYTDQTGVAKIAIFAYNRQTGRPLMQTGMHQTTSQAKDTWVLGMGPFQSGSARGHGTTFAGEPLRLPFLDDNELSHPPPVPFLSAATWSEPPTTPPSGTFASGRSDPPKLEAPKPPTLDIKQTGATEKK
jgi:hypothetical protein